MYCKIKINKMSLVLRRSKYFLLTLFCLVSIVGCEQIDIYEKNINIPNKKWQADLVANNIFNIDENGTYKVSVVVRHTDAYEYNNIWLNVGLQKDKEATKFNKENISLSNDANGWDGVGMNDIWEVRKEIIRLPLKKGIYKTSVQQIMRQNPLMHIMNVGIRVEKVGA